MSKSLTLTGRRRCKKIERMESPRTLLFLSLCSIWAALAAGCSDTRTVEQTFRSVRPPGVPGAALLHGSEGGRELLYGIPSRRLVPETTMSQAYRLRVVDRRGRVRAAADGDPLVLDAALDRRGRRVAMVLADGRLRITGLPLPRDLPRANPGLAFSPRGGRLAFVCGDPPETDVCIVEVPSGRWRRLVGGQGPQDRPAFTADGLAVLFVSAPDGVAGIWQVGLARDAEPVQRTNRGLTGAQINGPRFVPLPLGPQPMVHTGRELVFDSGEAVVRVGPRGVLTNDAVAPTGTLVLPGLGGRIVLVRSDHRGSRLSEVKP